MRRQVSLVAIASLLVLHGLCWGAMSLEDIPSSIENVACSGSIITKEEGVVVRDIQNLGPEAIPYLLPLLKHNNGEVRELTSYILFDMKGLREEHLDALIESKLRGNRWIFPAIAQVGTPRAITLLMDELKKEENEYSPVTYAFVVLGEKGVPHLVDLITKKPFDQKLLKPLVSIFDRLKDKAESAVAPHMEFISVGRGDKNAVTCAVRVLGAVGPRAHSAVPVLLRLSQDRPVAFKPMVDEALIHMGAPEAVPVLLERLERKPGARVFYDIANLKESGKEAGPTLIRYLSHDDWNVRVHAAQALGFIGYTGASADLIKLLRTNDDWRLVYVSAESLGRLHASDAIQALDEVSQAHWYPPVREAAQKAILVMNGQTTYERARQLWPEFSDYRFIGVSNRRPVEKGDPPYVEQGGHLDKAQLGQLPYRLEPVSSGPATGGRRTEKPDKTYWRIPSVGLEVADGYLLGSDQGEWGGELVHVDFEGQQATLLNENVHAIYAMTSGIVAVTGNLQGMEEQGVLYRISRTADGAWQARKWKILPNFPCTSGLLANGNLFVRCWYGESMEVSPAGEIKWLASPSDVDY